MAGRPIRVFVGSIVILLLAAHLVWWGAVQVAKAEPSPGMALDHLEILAKWHPLPAAAHCATADRLWDLTARNPNGALLGMSQTALERCLAWDEDPVRLSRYAWVRVMREQEGTSTIKVSEN